MKILKISLTFLICSFFFSNSFAQSWTDWKLLYKEKGLTIEISFNNRGCNVGKPVFIKYRLYGTIYDFSQYLIYRIDYIDCNGDNRFIDQAFNISKENPIFNGSLVQNGEPKNDADGVLTFYASEISDNFYNIKSYNNKPQLNQGTKTNDKSTKPTRIKTNGDFYCGESARLDVEGGSLSPGSAWYWYENSCGGTYLGKGSYIYATPTKDTKYFVRAEGKDVTSCTEIEVIPKIKKPESIEGKDYISFGDEVNLRVKNSDLCNGYQWQWYENSIYSNPIGYGPEITVRPFENTNYYVRSVGNGKESEYAEKTVNIYNNISSKISHNFNSSNTKLELKYEIDNCNSDEIYNIKIRAFKKNRGEIKLNSLSGDFKLVKGCNQKKAIWDFKKDGYSNYDEIYFQIIGNQQSHIPTGKNIVKSLLWPGWGTNDFTDESTEFRKGLISYSLIVNALFFHKLSQITNTNYLNSENESLYNKYNKNSNLFKNISLASALTAAAIITIDISKVIRCIEKKKKEQLNNQYNYNLKQFQINSRGIYLK